jgi:hypothetical protein
MRLAGGFLSALAEGKILLFHQFPHSLQAEESGMAFVHVKVVR